MKIPDETWPEQKFETQYAAMQELANQLKVEIVDKATPVEDYMMAAEPGQGGW